MNYTSPSKYVLFLLKTTSPSMHILPQHLTSTITKPKYQNFGVSNGFHYHSSLCKIILCHFLLILPHSIYPYFGFGLFTASIFCYYNKSTRIPKCEIAFLTTHKMPHYTIYHQNQKKNKNKQMTKHEELFQVKYQRFCGFP